MAEQVVISKLLLSEVLGLLAQVDLYFEHTDAPMGVTARELIQKILSSTGFRVQFSAHSEPKR